MKTRADLLRFAISVALMKVRVARHRLGLTEEMRAEVASDTVRVIRKTGKWQELDEALPDWPGTVPAPYEREQQ